MSDNNQTPSNNKEFLPFGKDNEKLANAQKQTTEV